MILIAVFLTSAATMAFELAGARMLAPYLGTSVEVWAGVIATILGGLSLGYWLGGKVADRHPHRGALAVVVFLAGITVTSAWALRDFIPELFVHLPLGSLTFTSFGIGVFLFVPASFFFGAISPYAVKLSLASLDVSARTVGRLSAIGAAGSIVGTIATGSWIMPRMGTNSLLMWIAILLFVLSALIAGRLHASQILIAVLALLGAYGTNQTIVRSSDLLADIDTRYGRVQLRELRDAESGIAVRSLHLDPYGVQCASFVNPNGSIREELVFTYTKAFDAALDLRPDAERLLMIGGCNYSYPRHLLSELPDARVDVVEIDEGMTDIARSYFGFEDDPRMTIYHEDARTFLNRSKGVYDVIFTDAFNSSSAIPHHLATEETFERIQAMLDEDGILAANIIGAIRGDAAAFLQAEIATLKNVFPVVRVFGLRPESSASVQNFLVLAAKTPQMLDQAAIDLAIGAVNGRTGLELTEISPEAFGGGMLLTDDYAPVESLTRIMREKQLGSWRN